MTNPTATFTPHRRDGRAIPIVAVLLLALVISSLLGFDQAAERVLSPITNPGRLLIGQHSATQDPIPLSRLMKPSSISEPFRDRPLFDDPGPKSEARGPNGPPDNTSEVLALPVVDGLSAQPDIAHGAGRPGPMFRGASSNPKLKKAKWQTRISTASTASLIGSTLLDASERHGEKRKDLKEKRGSK